MRYPESMEQSQTGGRQENGTAKEPPDPRLEKSISTICRALSEIFPEADKEQVKQAKVLARQLAFAQLEPQKKAEQLEKENTSLREQSDRDPYNPEIYSDNGWYRAMADKLRELRRNKQSAVILAFDLDGFKLYNDAQSSHVEGDKALGLAGQLAKSVLRPGDLIARLHGDEYVAVVGGARLENGVMVAERIRQAISQMPELLKTSIPFTVSVGVAILEAEVINTEYKSYEQLIAALKNSYALADQAHYEGAKKVGKNMIGVMFPDGTIRTAVITAKPEGQQPLVITYQTPQTTTLEHK